MYLKGACFHQRNSFKSLSQINICTVSSKMEFRIFFWKIFEFFMFWSEFFSSAMNFSQTYTGESHQICTVSRPWRFPFLHIHRKQLLYHWKFKMIVLGCVGVKTYFFVKFFALRVQYCIFSSKNGINFTLVLRHNNLSFKISQCS